jgi:hypothetical protein
VFYLFRSLLVCVNVEPDGQIHACVAKGGEVKDIDNNQTLSTKEQLKSNAYVLEVTNTLQ